MAGNVAFQVNKTINILGKTISCVEAVVDDMSIYRISDVPKAQPSVLTTRTDNTTGTLTMANGGHGIVTSQKVDLYWAGGFRAAVVVGTVSGTAVPLTNTGVGSNLPVATTPIIVGILQSENFAAIGNNIQGLGLGIDGPNPECIFSFMAADGTTVLWTRHLADGIGGDSWTTDVSWTNPLAGVTAASVRVSHADTAILRRMTIAAVLH